MSEFLRYVLYELKNSLVLVLLAGVLAAAGLAVAFIVHKKKYKGQRKFPWGKVFLWLMFLGYLLIVVYTVFKTFLIDILIREIIEMNFKSGSRTFLRKRRLQIKIDRSERNIGLIKLCTNIQQ